MRTFEARIYQALGLLQGFAARMAEDGEMSDADLSEIICSMGHIQAAIEYELELRNEARCVADDKSAAREKC